MHLGISHVSLRRAALFGWPSVGVLQMFKCATCQIQQAPCTTAPARAAYNGPGRLGTPARGTAGALAQGTALHSGAKMGKSSVASRAASSQRRWA